ncbi:MarR family transcriptional regulator [Photobacterium leiognathi]|uniref:hypothetical protein n=1 Tax=Photobacterium leiognathi TaxID=553611 RepID=UPI001EDED649|nr:hypothetical protein [Photobacterium leiognathi]MCG3884509.1 MarR family transcriptional regulator [Photobacterium leiognathi]
MVNFEIAAKEFQPSSDNLDDLIKSPDNKKVIWFNSLEQVVSLISGVNHNILAAVKTGNNITIGYLKKKFGLDHYQAQARIDSLIDAGC